MDLLKIVLCLVSLCVMPFSNTAAEINISLAYYSPSANISFTAKEVLTSGISTLNVQDVPPSVGFFVVQVHAFQQPIIVSNVSTFDSRTYVNGTNVGLVQLIDGSDAYSFYIWAKRNVSAFIAVVAYETDDPVPGGCNLTFQTEIAAYQNVTNDGKMVVTEAQAASVNGHACEENLGHLDMYHLYLREWDFTEGSYFDGIYQMMTPENIVKYGTKVPQPIRHPMRRYYNAYEGIGSVYAIVARHKNRTSAYIPAVSYVCESFKDGKCQDELGTIWKVICAVLFFLGLMICLFGHSFFLLTNFLSASLVGSFFAYILFVQFSIDSYVVPIVVGPIFGVLWTIVMINCYVPVLSTLTTYTTMGYFIATLVFHYIMGDNQFFQTDLIYWPTFTCMILVINILLTTLLKYGNIIATSFLGAYVVVWPIDYYIGSYLHYIVIFVVRRATVANYHLAIIDPPIQLKDIVLLTVWVIVALYGLKFQHRVHKNSPPLPSNERTPLLA